MDKKYLLYLRADICNTELVVGGSVGHTIGVIKGFIDEGYQVVCASSCMIKVLKNMPLVELVVLKNPACIEWLRWKMNCFLSSFFFFFQAKKVMKEYPQLVCIYQRYTLLNMTGVLLAWWYHKKLILEYNGSEAWAAVHWGNKRHFMPADWLMNKVERINIHSADFLVVVSEVLKDELVDRGVCSEKILVNPNGVDPLMFSSVYQKGRVNEYSRE